MKVTRQQAKSILEAFADHQNKIEPIPTLDHDDIKYFLDQEQAKQNGLIMIQPESLTDLQDEFNQKRDELIRLDKKIKELQKEAEEEEGLYTDRQVGDYYKAIEKLQKQSEEQEQKRIQQLGEALKDALSEKIKRIINN